MKFSVAFVAGAMCVMHVSAAESTSRPGKPSDFTAEIFEELTPNTSNFNTEEIQRDLGKKRGDGGFAGSSPMYYNSAPMYYSSTPLYSAPMTWNQSPYSWRHLGEEVPTTETQESIESTPLTEEQNRDLGKKYRGSVGSSWYGASPMFYGPAPMYASPMYATPMWGNSWGPRFLDESMPTPNMEMEMREQYENLKAEETRDLGKKNRGVSSSWYGASPSYYGPAPMYAAPMWSNSWTHSPSAWRYLEEEIPAPEQVEMRAETEAKPMRTFEERLLKKKSRGVGDESWGRSYSSYGPSYYGPSYYSTPSYNSYPMWGNRRFLAEADSSAEMAEVPMEMQPVERNGEARGLQSHHHGHHDHHHHGGMGMGYGNGMYGNGMYGNGYGNGMYGNGMYGGGMYGNGGRYGALGLLSRFLEEEKL